jgi:hypothetical protein
MKCPVCEGKGGWYENWGEGTVLQEPCPECNETGQMNIFKWINFHLWNQNLLWRTLPVICFFKGHNMRPGYPENYQPEYCDRCGKEF